GLYLLSLPTSCPTRNPSFALALLPWPEEGKRAEGCACLEALSTDRLVMKDILPWAPSLSLSGRL
uniref:Uncharacterized protein n=1 Tax=Balaenoptera musculus TaxID=9771 RepID=A0A8C0DIH9_BALMU